MTLHLANSQQPYLFLRTKQFICYKIISYDSIVDTIKKGQPRNGIQFLNDFKKALNDLSNEIKIL